MMERPPANSLEQRGSSFQEEKPKLAKARHWTIAVLAQGTKRPQYIREVLHWIPLQQRITLRPLVWQ